MDNGESHNTELHALYSSSNIIRNVKLRRLRWAGHVRRMEECETPKRILEYKMDGKRRVGRPRLRWEDCIVKNIKKLGVKEWWNLAMDRI